ncbi:DNRLRE domain-containing protein [Baekduia soli]|uniref:DNRLRE domain-containing protein n=1 Tax=Baekduia soli TaxID=496014 RepID=A0A5B8U834_9ACTN|nr:DNRLRE domain-containing protein [Baekduia soli]QEC49121.1 DNRLRE domain-containing protein [Baekduia soli]
MSIRLTLLGRLRLPVLAALIAAAAVLALSAASAAPAHAATAPTTDIGHKDQSYADAYDVGGSITGTKPESKLWFNDGTWWSDMYSATLGVHRIYKLNRATETWSDAGTTLDSRPKTRSDILWDSATGKLYVASHSYTSQSSTTTTGTDGKLWRYSYNPISHTYSVDAGFPVNLGSAKTETLVIDRDTTGRLWATWTANLQVWVTHSTSAGDTSWVTPYVLPGSGTLNADDISSVVAFKGFIGIQWSAQDKTTTPYSGNEWFAVHKDGAGDTAADWSASTIPTGYSPDDHINLKADADGNVFIASKTSESTSTNPLIFLLKRTLTSTTTGAGTWTKAVFGTVADSNTRPIVVLDPTDDQAHVFATCPQPPYTSGQSGGDICEKVSPMSSLSLPAGQGTPVMRDHTSQDMNDVTSTKQPVSPTTGLVAMANDKTTKLYWHSDEPLGDGPPPTGPTASFTATPTSGTAPLVVQFTDTSTGSPTTHAWNFGDGTPVDTTANPQHTYSTPGTYDVTLSVSNANGSDSVTQSGLITVASGSTSGQTTFTDVADAPVKSTSATRNYGTDTSLRVRQGTSSTDTFYHSYLKFDVSGLGGTPTDAKLRLFVTDASPDGGRVFSVANTWAESTITWASAPAIGATSIGSAGTTTAGAWVEIDLGTAVTGNGTYSFALTNTSSNSAYYSSREGTNAPQLVVTAGGGSPPPPGQPTADFSATPTSGSAPLATTFTSLASSDVDGWTWDFGDGSPVSHAQNPAHSYTTPGTYDVTLTVSRSSDGATATSTKNGYITVSATPPPPSGTLTFTPTADAHVKSSSPSSNYGTATTLQIRQGDASNPVTYVTYLKFAVSGLNGAVPTSARLRLFVTDASTDGGSVFRVGDAWTETTLNWNNRPLLPATSVGTAGAVAAGAYVDIDLGSAITGDGTYSFAIASSSTNSAIYSSRETTNPPQLVLGT